MPRVAGAAYIELFSGPGRAQIRGTTKIIDGSPLVAYKTAYEGGVPFSEIHLADVVAEYSDAAMKRVVALGGRATAYAGTAEETARQIVAKLDPSGFHFAFLDPFNLESLTFETIRLLSQLKRVDLLLHISVLDLQRNFDRYTVLQTSPLDAFAPGWRTHVDQKQSQTSLRAAYMAYWQSLVQGLGFANSPVELVTGGNNQRLYWLAFLSRNPLGKDFWNKIRHITGQRGFDL